MYSCLLVLLKTKEDLPICYGIMKKDYGSVIVRAACKHNKYPSFACPPKHVDISQHACIHVAHRHIVDANMLITTMQLRVWRWNIPNSD
jgi:hypothetical protein